ncbi:LTA synthase family protein [Coraliomargarita sp. W4R53]
MIKKLNSFLGPYLPIALLYGLGLPLLSFSRAALACWQSERIAAAGIGWGTFFLQGIRADIIQVSLLCAPLLVLLPFLATRWTWPAWRRISYSWILISVLFLVFLEASTPSFIVQYDFRPNRLFIEYLKYPKEVFSTLWHGFRAALLLGVGISIFLAWASSRLFSFWLKAPQTWGYLKQLCFLPFVGFLIFAGIRSTADHRAANPALFAVTQDPLVNSLIINSSWSVFHAIYNLKHEAKSSEVYGDMSVEDILKATHLWQGAAQLSSEMPLMRWHEASVQRERPLNLVIVLEESLGATFVESLGGRPVTPEIEKLKDEGWWFENLYATGTRSVRGIEAVTAGFLPTPARSVVKLSLSQSNFFTIANLLQAKNYFTEFIYGGEAHFDNMRLFFTGNGFESIVDQHDFVEPVFAGTWGASDEDLFNKADERIQKLHDSGQPFFSLVFTSSNHSPFEYPEGRIELFDEDPATENNAVKYADYALGQFIKTAKTRDYWKDTLFLVVADHDIRVRGDSLVPVKHFHIPGFILGADIEPRRIKTVASQVDLPTTLLSLMGISAEHPMIGRDLSTEPAGLPGRAFMQYGENYCMMEGDELVILRPEKAPTFALYDFAAKKLLESDRQNPEQANRALAHALLPSWLYRKQLYGWSTEPAATLGTDK